MIDQNCQQQPFLVPPLPSLSSEKSSHELILEPEKSLVDNSLSSTIFSHHNDTFSRSPVGDSRNKINLVTAALRSVKWKPIRKIREPLNEIECSSKNVDNSRNIEPHRLKFNDRRDDQYGDTDKTVKKNCENDGNDSGSNLSFCDILSPSDSE